MSLAQRNVTRIDQQDDWPATPDARYGQLGNDNVWSADNGFSNFTGNYRPAISSLGEYFDANDGSTPIGWVANDTANVTNQNKLPGFWYLQNNASSSFDYSKEIVTIPVTSWQSFKFNQIRVRDGGFTGNQDIYYGIYGDTGSGMDDDIFLRCHLQWDSVSDIWQVRSQRKDGTTQVDGSWFQLDSFMPKDFFIRCVKANVLNIIRVYFGSSEFADQQKSITNTSMDRTLWDNGVHWRIEATHGGGVQMYSYIGSVDIGDEP